MRIDLEQYWRELGQAMEAMPFALLEEVADTLLQCHHRGGTVFIVGNGGSAATASHFACDLAKGTQTSGVPPFRVMPLTDNMPLITAWANDVGYEHVFAQQLVTLARPGDALVVISASGNSANVLEAARAARRHGVSTIAFTGATGGKLRRLADLTVRVPSPSIEQVEDAHLIIGHSLCVALRSRLRHEAADRAILRAPVPGLMALDADTSASVAV